MKLVTVFLLISFMACAFVACQKEVTFNLNDPSSGTLKSSDLGDCLPSAVKGTYIANAILTNNNFIEATLNVVIPGTYNIKSDTINGFSFSGAGTLNTSGLHTIKLQGSGIPVGAGIDLFSISYNNASCKIPVNVVVE